MKNGIIFLIAGMLWLTSTAQQKIENLIIVTTDGLRWQEVFTGMDSSVANSRQYNQDDSAYLFRGYWNESANERRKLLMPLFPRMLTSKKALAFGKK